HRLAGEQRRRLLPPRRLLRPVTVPPRRLIRLKPCQGNQPSVVSNPRCAAQPPHGPRGHLLDPSAELRAHLRGVGHTALEHLHKHVDLPLAHPPGGCRSVASTLRPSPGTAKPPPAQALRPRETPTPRIPTTRKRASPSDAR